MFSTASADGGRRNVINVRLSPGNWSDFISVLQHDTDLKIPVTADPFLSAMYFRDKKKNGISTRVRGNQGDILFIYIFNELYESVLLSYIRL